jgi:hypothetical protein
MAIPAISLEPVILERGMRPIYVFHRVAGSGGVRVELQ